MTIYVVGDVQIEAELMTILEEFSVVFMQCYAQPMVVLCFGDGLQLCVSRSMSVCNILFPDCGVSRTTMLQRYGKHRPLRDQV